METARALLIRIVCIVLFWATRGEILKGSSSKENQPARPAAGTLASHPMRTSKPYGTSRRVCTHSQSGTYELCSRRQDCGLLGRSVTSVEVGAKWEALFGRGAV